jgi:molybdenum cofactor synthesis domain-containing protein
MRPFTSVISIDEARRRLDGGVVPIARTERLALAAAAGRVAAEAVASAIDVPPFSRSAMDGFAVRAADTRGASRERPIHLRVIDAIYTGQVSRARVDAGACARIATGAPIPDGADAVVMVEETARQTDGGVDVLAEATTGQNIGRRGADIRTGDAVAAPGDWMSPSRIGAAAAVGCAGIAVFEKPRVAILSTGNEVIEPGRPIAPGQIYDVNRFTLAAVVEAHGGIAVPLAPVGDTIDGLLAALDACRDAGADVVVFSGGSSVGDRDLILDVVAARGRMIFHGIAVKPGKPTAFAHLAGPDGRATPFFGMPGNPTSCLSNAYILLVPFLRATARLPRWAPRIHRARLARRITSVPDRHQFYTVRLDGDTAVPAFKGSGEITSLSQADGYIEIASEVTAIEAGTPVDVTLF